MPRWIKIETAPADDGPRKGRRERPPEAPPEVAGGLPLRWVVVGMLAVVAIGAAGLWLGRQRLSGAGGLPAPGAPPAAAGALALVDGRAVADRDIDVEAAVQKVLQAQTGRVTADDPVSTAAFRRELLSQVIDQWLLFQAAERAGIGVTDADVAADMPRMLGQYGLDPAALQQRVLAAGITAAEFQAWSRRQVANGRYLQSPAAQSLTGGLSADPDRVAAALQQTADVVLYMGGSAVRPARQGAPAPDLSLPALDGSTLTLSDLKGKPVILNFWATWCGPCKIEMPLFIHAYDSHKDRLAMIGVNVQEQAGPVQAFVGQYGITFPVVLDADGQVSTIYQVRALPTTVFIAADGTVSAMHRGAILSRPDLQPYLDRILGTATSWLPPLDGWLRVAGL